MNSKYVIRYEVKSQNYKNGRRRFTLDKTNYYLMAKFYQFIANLYFRDMCGYKSHRFWIEKSSTAYRLDRFKKF